MNRSIIVLLFLSSLFSNAYSQNDDCSCATDLAFLDSKLRKTPAYKINKNAYQASYSKIVEEAASITSIYDCHSILNELLISLNDNHSRVFGTEPGATDVVTADPEKFEEFKKSALFNAYPKPPMDLDSLQTVLSNKPVTDVEGIYHRKNFMTIGVYRTTEGNKYKAVVIDSEFDVWQTGEIMYTLIPFGNNYLLNSGGGISSKRLIAYTERIEDGFFYFMGFQKDNSKINYASSSPSESTYYREELSDDITYLKIGSFSSWNPTLSEAEKFYKTLEGNLTKDNLIIDLRNNGGGGDRNSDILYKLLKKYSKKNKIYVLTNHRTASNAEQFAYKLRKLDNCQIFGSRTNGSLAYEIKNSTYTLPCGTFVAVLTSKKHSEYLELESQGIEPDVALTWNGDWIDQLTNYIKKSS